MYSVVIIKDELNEYSFFLNILKTYFYAAGGNLLVGDAAFGFSENDTGRIFIVQLIG